MRISEYRSSCASSRTFSQPRHDDVALFGMFLKQPPQPLVLLVLGPSKRRNLEPSKRSKTKETGVASTLDTSKGRCFHVPVGKP